MTVTEPPPIYPRATALDGTQACIYGCKLRDVHDPHCPCQTTCPEHENHCTGCAPRPAHDSSLLCGSCFHRRLRSPLRRMVPLYDWLTSRKAGLKATTYDADLVSSSKEAPLPFNPDIVDALAVMDLLLNGWAVRVAQEAPPAPGPPASGTVASARWLDERTTWIAEQDWVPLLCWHLHELQQRARQLAPWQATRHALPMPCLKCEQQTLVLFGGDDWVTCTNPDCDAIIGWFRYQSLSRAIGRIYSEDGSQAG